MADSTGFHAGGGWFFKRLGDGLVEIRAPAGTNIFDKDTWASIVASVSAAGDNAEAFDFASAVHAGDISSCQIRRPESEASDA